MTTHVHQVRDEIVGVVERAEGPVHTPSKLVRQAPMLLDRRFRRPCSLLVIAKDVEATG
jgi:hypothetical protein